MEMVMNYTLDELWPQLTPDEQRCVFAYRFSNTKSEAFRQIGRNPKWLENRKRRHPAFRAAMASRWFGEDLTARLIPELLDRVMLRVTTETDPAMLRHYVSAMKTLGRIAEGLGVRTAGKHPRPVAMPEAYL